MKVLITGINGFLGRAIAEEYLKRQNVEVTGIARSRGNLPVTYYCVDILNGDGVEAVFRKGPYDVVIHLAALTAHEQIVDNKFAALDINLNGTRNILAAFNKYCRGGLFVYASTGKVYGDTNEMPITEKAVTYPTNILGKSKLITERLIDFYVQPNHKYLIARIFNIYGGDQKENFVVPTILKQLVTGSSLTLGSLTDQRDYLYIRDFTEAMVKCIDHCDRLEQFEILNFGSGVPQSVGDIVSAFEKSLGIQIFVTSDMKKMRRDEMPVEYCDNTKLRRLAGWEMTYTLETAIDEICREKGLK